MLDRLAAVECPAFRHRRRHRPGGEEAADPIVLARGEGSYVWDVDGRRYLDLAAGWEEYGFPLETALARVGAARCLVKLGRHREALDRLALARPTLVALGAMPYLDELEAVERQAST